MVRRVTTRLKVDLAFAVALLLLGTAAALSYLSVRELRTTQNWVAHTQQVLREIDAVGSDLRDAEAAQRGYVLTGQERFLTPYLAAPPSVAAEMRSLERLVVDNPEQRQRIAVLRTLARRRLDLLDEPLQMARRGDFAAAAQIIRNGEGQQVMDSIRALSGTLRNAEFVLLQERRAREAAIAERTVVLVLFGSLLAVAIVAVSRQSLVGELHARERAEESLELNERSLRELYTIASSQELAYEEKLRRLVEMGANRFGLSTGVLARGRGGRYTVEAVHDATRRIRPGDVYDGAPVLDGRDAFGLEAHLAIPVRMGGEVYGLLAFSDPRPSQREFTESEEDFLRLIAEWIGGELERRAAAEVLRQREERYRVLVESASDLIFTTDPTGRFTYANPSAASVLGYDQERLRDLGSLDLVRPDRRGELRERLERQVREQRHTAYYEAPVLARDGREVWLGQNVQVLRSADGRVNGMQVVARDITRQLEMERMKDEFLSVVSHELRTPLTSIRGSLGLLASGRMGTLDERGQRMLEIAAQNTDRLVRLINDLLDIEKIESGRAQMEREPVELNRLIAETVEAMQPLTEKAGVTLESEAAEATLLADPDRVLQVLTNLVSNAVKFSNPGGTVSISARMGDGEAVVSVRDRGRGIPTDKQGAIFERFQQVDSSDARQKGGTGLGLSIARSIVQQHGGRIWVESDWGEGSTFFFTLPLHRPTAAASRALICEDDPAVARYLREVLERGGYAVEVAADGEAALEAARPQRPSVLLLDLGLPGLDGAEVIRRLRENPQTCDVPVVVVSGTPERDSTIDPTTVAAWLQKPVDPQTLLAVVERAALEVASHYDVLLVEDDDGLAGVMVETLREHGVSVCHARDGGEAIDLSRRMTFDLLLLDPGLPEVDGWEVVDWLRRHNRHRHVPVLVYTARDLDDDARERLRLGPTEFMTKTRNPLGQLEERVMALLDRADARETTEE